MWLQAEVGPELLRVHPACVCVWVRNLSTKSWYAVNKARTSSLFMTAKIKKNSFNKGFMDPLQTSDIDSSFLRCFETGNELKILQIGIKKPA